MNSHVPIYRGNWSRSSQRSDHGHYDQNAIHYEGLALRCRACSAGFAFTPEQQHKSYEVEKKFIWWLPSFCTLCEERLTTLKALDRDFQNRWNASRLSLANDDKFLQEWLTVVVEKSRYGKANCSLEQMLLKLLRALPIEQGRDAT